MTTGAGTGTGTASGGGGASAALGSAYSAKIYTKEIEIIRFLNVVISYHCPLCAPLSQYRN
jgi:hypothetical protein